MIHQHTTLERLPEAYKILFTGFLLVIGIGLLMAGEQIMLTHGKADGKPGLSINDIIYSYYGNRTGSKLETMLKGQMKPMAPDEVRFELIEWAEDGAPMTEWASKIKPRLDQYCVSCHNADSGLPDFTKPENVQKVAEIDHGASITSLTRVSHIHLFGIAFIFMFVGWIFGLAEFPRKWKLILIATPFAFLIVDVLSWWLTKFFSIFAWLTMIGGIGYSLASTVMILTSLAQMWLPRTQWLKYWTSEQPASADGS
ncbi:MULTISPECIES: elongation factor-1 alpha [unclassified Methylococcus]|uniref:elongation factor-1 alpha n=1 Tax=unclassified Methylococcus TaxID=2618889 RepID=UPI003D7CD75E